MLVLHRPIRGQRIGRNPNQEVTITMKMALTAAIAVAVAISGSAWAECPASMNGGPVSITGTVAKLKQNPHFSHWSGDWSLRVDVAEGPCAGLVVIKTDDKPICYPGQEVSVPGKVFRATFFGKRTSVESDQKILCGAAPVRKTASANSRELDAGR